METVLEHMTRVVYDLQFGAMSDEAWRQKWTSIKNQTPDHVMIRWAKIALRRLEDLS